MHGLGGMFAAMVSGRVERARKPNTPVVLLAHGAWADGSSWSDVISRLQARGIVTAAVQLPLTSLSEDVATLQRSIAMQTGPILLVGHSYGGAVITQAGIDNQVAGLVYIAAFAPNAGQSINQLQKPYPTPEYAGLLQTDAAGFLHFPQESFPHHFAQDLPTINAQVMAATQGPIRASAFDESVSYAAWRTKPSWYLMTDRDRMIYPQLQEEMADRMGACVTRVRASHVPFLSRPRETTTLILEAVNRVGSR